MTNILCVHAAYATLLNCSRFESGSGVVAHCIMFYHGGREPTPLESRHHGLAKMHFHQLPQSNGHVLLCSRHVPMNSPMSNNMGELGNAHHQYIRQKLDRDDHKTSIGLIQYWFYPLQISDSLLPDSDYIRNVIADQLIQQSVTDPANDSSLCVYAIRLEVLVCSWDI